MSKEARLPTVISLSLALWPHVRPKWYKIYTNHRVTWRGANNKSHSYFFFSIASPLFCWSEHEVNKRPWFTHRPIGTIGHNRIVTMIHFYHQVFSEFWEGESCHGIRSTIFIQIRNPKNRAPKNFGAGHVKLGAFASIACKTIIFLLWVVWKWFSINWHW